ncbi:hypothetical protein HUX88_25950 [Duganella sp. BJB1802]|uniref:hypothetical protein n=1 Tax=Duganella sp. BJB1802 TaxID=2744575 RepID=UPI001593FB8E|nr:hypothetical protein [Duganella sp. BJB1802]NVD73945.1 hypothetical protein [Duganella sp. BJB1802]
MKAGRPQAAARRRGSAQRVELGLQQRRLYSRAPAASICLVEGVPAPSPASRNALPSSASPISSPIVAVQHGGQEQQRGVHAAVERR